jgi:hypothetical protein
MRDNALHGFSSDLALADLLVAVEVFAEFVFAVVEVHDGEVIKTDGFIEVLQSTFQTFRSTHVMAKGESVTGVEASGEAWSTQLFQHEPDVLERPTQTCALVAFGEVAQNIHDA